ncbi:TetR/AcrR family transcriptional regulator [Pseudonocardia sp. HH130630-07]|uniref:TetR/AcrR family transcriptional regulator n=1 Tax=Pseudonocardia sp. HH130630-07 TaxID=1690815 RepID=UPI000839C323|nr:TetR/AcrR family transcriptional regulator [Pseudonocardia sp. HH130630-07]
MPPRRATTSPRTRNPRGEGSRLREEIVAAAADLLEHGTATAVTLRAVARAAGITAPSIYRHFADVEAILRGVADDAFAELREDLRRAQDRAGERPVHRLLEICRCHLDFARSRPERYRLMFGGARNAADGHGPAGRAPAGRDAFVVLVDAVSACIAARESTSTDAHADATALWVGLHGLAGLREATPPFPWPPGLEDRLVRTLARITRTRPSPAPGRPVRRPGGHPATGPPAPSHLGP